MQRLKYKISNIPVSILLNLLNKYDNADAEVEITIEKKVDPFVDSGITQGYTHAYYDFISIKVNTDINEASKEEAFNLVDEISKWSRSK